MVFGESERLVRGERGCVADRHLQHAPGGPARGRPPPAGRHQPRGQTATAMLGRTASRALWSTYPTTVARTAPTVMCATPQPTSPVVRTCRWAGVGSVVPVVFPPFARRLGQDLHLVA